MIQRHDPAQAPNQSPQNDPQQAAQPSDELIAPGTPRPLSPRRTNWKPDDEPGTDELAGGASPTPAEVEPRAAADQRPFDIDPDAAELDDQFDPR